MAMSIGLIRGQAEIVIRGACGLAADRNLEGARRRKVQGPAELRLDPRDAHVALEYLDVVHELGDGPVIGQRLIFFQNLSPIPPVTFAIHEKKFAGCK